ncbi:hypothetical protein [Candidatus Tisiphia endosymbiont of Oplodontha viridula]
MHNRLDFIVFYLIQWLFLRDDTHNCRKLENEDDLEVIRVT